MGMNCRSKKQPETVCGQKGIRPSQGGLGKALRDVEFAWWGRKGIRDLRRMEARLDPPIHQSLFFS